MALFQFWAMIWKAIDEFSRLSMSKRDLERFRNQKMNLCRDRNMSVGFGVVAFMFRMIFYRWLGCWNVFWCIKKYSMPPSWFVGVACNDVQSLYRWVFLSFPLVALVEDEKCQEERLLAPQLSPLVFLSYVVSMQRSFFCIHLALVRFPLLRLIVIIGLNLTWLVGAAFLWTSVGFLHPSIVSSAPMGLQSVMPA